MRAGCAGVDGSTAVAPPVFEYTASEVPGCHACAPAVSTRDLAAIRPSDLRRGGPNPVHSRVRLSPASPQLLPVHVM